MSRQTNPTPGSQMNMILAIVLTGIILFAWPSLMHYFWPNADRPAPAATQAPVAKGQTAPSGPAAADPATLTPTREGGLTSPGDQAIEARQLPGTLAASTRIPIAAPSLSGSINLAGGVIDDLTLNRYKATLEKNSGPVRIFSPARTLAQHFAQFGWMAGDGTGTAGMLPDGNSQWQAPAGAKLTPSTPVTLSWTNPAGQIFTLTYAIDKNYMITVTQGVTNKGQAPLAIRPFALIDRTDRTASMDSWNIHSGPFGAFDNSVHFKPKYKDVLAAGEIDNVGHTDWLGFTDIYWMSVLVPGAADHGGANNGAASNFRAMGGGIYVAELLYHGQTVAPGQSASLTTRLFAGAKESLVLDRYEAGANGQPGIANFGHAIDWGWFMFFEKPIFWLLRTLFNATGNFGVAIILLTLVVRLIMFPVAHRQFASMAAMRALQPKMTALRERHKDDKQKLQEETMRLYKEEKVNPLAGCLPIFLQIPVFFALYKVLMVAIEMRHQPFVGWIRDLSAPDPLHFFTLFGYLHYQLPSFLELGPLGLLLGITMYAQFRLQPAQPDPTQQQMMAIMPWVMMFIMSGFASGLLVYWITSNCLTMAQQAYLYSRHPQLRAQAAKTAADTKRTAARTKK